MDEHHISLKKKKKKSVDDCRVEKAIAKLDDSAHKYPGNIVHFRDMGSSKLWAVSKSWAFPGHR